MRPIYLFDDGRALLTPLTDLRPMFDVRTGALTLIGRLAAAGELQVIGVFVPDTLAALTRERHTVSVNPVLDRRQGFIAVNARCPMVRAADIERLGQPGSALVHGSSGEIIAAHLTPDLLPAVLAGDTAPFRLEKSREDPLLDPFTRPWHIRARRDALIRLDLAFLFTAMAQADTHAAGSSTHVAATAKVHSGVVFDTDGGPVYLADHAVVRPGAVLCGPCYIGPHSTVMDRAVIRGSTSIGPHCKVAGEISGTIFQSFSNKAHDGFLGDSWIGEWVNLGAGTTNSNLLNTYAEVIARVTPDATNEYTGQQFLGATIGDHVKTAICTRIMTGCIIHTGSMIATTAAATGCIPPFAWCTDDGVRQFRLAKFLDVVRAMMARRTLTPTAAYLQRISELHAALTPPAEPAT